MQTNPAQNSARINAAAVALAAVAGIAAVSMFSGQAPRASSADIIRPGDTATALVTADNHYALYTGDASGVTFVGTNETGAGGAPGTYNWSRPEPWTFTTGQFIYIAAWSDNSIAQGLLASISIGLSTLHSGDARWEVYRSNQDLGDGAARPTDATVTGWINTATAGNLWETPHVGGANGIAPWDTVPGIGTDPRWMWTAVPGDADPLVGGSGYGETLLFRIAVPTPGALMLAGLGGLLVTRRQRPKQ